MLPASEMIPVSIAFSLLTLLLVSSVTDLAWQRIPNLLLLSALLIALMLKISDQGISGVLTMIAGLTVGLAFLMPLYVMGSMGAGDVKLLGVVGAFLGPWGAFVAGIATLIAGAILGIACIAWRGIEPILVQLSSRLLTFFQAGNHFTMIPSYLTAPDRGDKIAYAPAIASGAIFSMWQQGLLAYLTWVG